VIWLATGFFVVMLFWPLISEVLTRLAASGAGGPP
jgi:hypothetical protein